MMRKVDIGKRYFLQKSFVFLLLFSAMAIAFYTLNGIVIDRGSGNLTSIFNLFPRLNRTVYVPGKEWRAKYRFLQQNPAFKQQHKSSDVPASKTEVSSIKKKKEKMHYKWPEIVEATENNTKDLTLMNGIRKIKNMNVNHPNIASKNTQEAPIENIQIIQNNPGNFVPDKRKIESYNHHSQNHSVYGNIMDASKKSEMPIFNDLEHESYINRLLSHGHPVLSINCRKLIDGNLVEIKKAKKVQSKQQVIPNRYYDIQTKNCEVFKRRYGYITSPLTKEERDFPLAYSILMYKDVEQVERLLRAIYRPQNSYCIHIDAKTRPTIRNSMKNIVKCFPNVFITSRSVDVRWGKFSVLEPELICMEELWKHKKWKYFINLTGQEFPLKTNYELVQILTAYNGSNDLEGTVKRANSGRWRAVGPPPANIRPTKGAVHVIVQRGFVDYVLHSPVAKDFLEWVKQINVPDETFFSTLNHNPHLKVPGSYLGVPETGPSKPFLARFKLWVFEDSPFHGTCHGKWVHAICIFGIRDLPELVQRKELFANKFHNNYQPLAQRCLNEWIFNNTRDYFFNQKTFDTSYYKQFDFVKQKV